MSAARQPHLVRYAVVFRVGSGEPAAGALAVAGDRLLFEGRAAEGEVNLSVPCAEIVEVRIGRSAQERLHGHPTLLLARAGGAPIQVEPLGAGLLHELADLLAALARAEAGEQLAVIVPLKRGRLARARELVAQGPPFDPAALGLTRHQVFLREEEAIFVFAGARVRETLERASRDPTLWRMGLAWRGCLGGRPRITAAPDPAAGEELAYSWAASGDPARAR